MLLHKWMLFLLLTAMALSGHARVDDGSARIKLSGLLADGVESRVTIKQIESIGVAEISVYNPYEKKTETYTGVWMDEFVKRFASPEVKLMRSRAIDDYQIDFTGDDWQTTRILMDTRTNGRYIGFENKGPMRIIFADYDPKLEKYQVSLPKWMWMITSINFE